MTRIYFVILFKLCFAITVCSYLIRDKEVPEMYKMENYEKCRETRGKYCAFDLEMTPIDPNSKLWVRIKESQSDPFKLDRSVLNRMICMPDFALPGKYGKQIIESELYGFNVTIDITSMECEKEFNFPYFKNIFWTIVAVYVAVTVKATISTKIHPYCVRTNPKKWYEAFSITRNIRKLFEINPKEDFQRLKCIQGIRVFNTALVVFWHTVISLFQSYVDDVDKLEKSYENPLFFYIMFLGAFCVQIFFMISTFLLTNQIYDLHKRHGFLSIYHCYIFIVNRMIRFLPTLLLALAVTRLGLYDHSPHTMRARNICVPICQQYWWLTLLQMNFLLPFNKICTPVLWYLSVDTLYYITTLVTLYLVLRLKWNGWKMPAVLMLLQIIYFGIKIYNNKYDFMLQPYPKTLKNMMVNSETMTNVYLSPIGSWPSSWIGLILGYTYHHNKERRYVILSRKQEILLWITIACVSLLAVHICTRSFHGILGGVVGACLKPAFVAPLGIGILGMAFGLGGIVRKFLESTILLTLSNITYCTYVFHFFIVFAKGLFSTGLLHYESHHMINWIIFDIITSFALGTVGTILIEYPGLVLQKMYLPQIKSTKKINETKSALIYNKKE